MAKLTRQAPKTLIDTKQPFMAAPLQHRFRSVMALCQMGIVSGREVTEGERLDARTVPPG